MSKIVTPESDAAPDPLSPDQLDATNLSTLLLSQSKSEEAANVLCQRSVSDYLAHAERGGMSTIVATEELAVPEDFSFSSYCADLDVFATQGTTIVVVAARGISASAYTAEVTANTVVSVLPNSPERPVPVFAVPACAISLPHVDADCMSHDDAIIELDVML